MAIPSLNVGNIHAVAQKTASGPNAFELGKKVQHAYLEGKHKKAKMVAAQQNQQQKAAQAAYNKDHADAKLANQAFNARKANAQKAAAAQQAGAKKAAAAHAAGVKKGTAAPMPGAAPRTFAMPAGPQGQAQKAHAAASAAAVKTMQAQRNHAHGQAIQMQNQMNKQAGQAQAQHAKVMQQQINTAHGEALKVQAGMDKEKNAPFAAAKKGKAVPLNVQPRSAGFQQHQQPAGSSTKPLPTLSANESAKTGRPNTFTTGSKKPSAKSNVSGLAAMGSQLEAGLASKRLTLPEPRKRV